MGLARKVVVVMGGVAVASVASAQQKVTGPVAVYWMSASTQTGFGMPGAGGAAANPRAMMRAMMGGGGANKSLTLQLGSGQTAPAPAADHLPPPGLGAGAALPLLSPKVTPTPPVERGPEIPREYQKPRGKILIFWGCGEHARPGQPVIIDFAALSKNPTAAMTAFKGIDVRAQTPPSAYRNKTYGEWPNERTQTSVPANGSLVGAHTVRGNYSPQIDFSLDEDQDFLGPLNLTTNAKAAGGWANLGWNLVGNAEAYLATAIGGDGETVVMWSSSETQSAGFAMPDYLTSPDITRLVANRTLMGPGQRACAVPKEVLDAMPQGLVQMAAYRGEANFVYPPRPSDPRAAWNQQWAVKVRYRSATGGLLGMEMPQMPGAGAYAPSRGGAPGAQQPGQPPRKPKASDILRGLGGFPFPR
jgi:hypothetical protein